MSATGPSDPVAPAPSLGVQVVVYENHVDGLARVGSAIAATLRAGREAGSIGRAVVRFGDCSPAPVFDAAAMDALRGAIGGAADAVTFAYFDANLGSAGGSNALAAAGDEDLIWVLNPDTYPAPTAVIELAGRVSGDGVAVAEARQIPVEHQKWYDPVTGVTGWATGACLMVRRDAFDAVGGFDERFFPLYCDDVDLSWRLRLAGWQILHVPSAVVFHDKRPHVDGAVRWSPTEARSSLLARLCLHRRYGRPDLEADLLDQLDRSDDAERRDVAVEFRRRVEAGEVPEPLPGASSVAEFVDGQYAPRRFTYLS